MAMAQTSVLTRYVRILRIVLHTFIGLLIASLIFPVTSQGIRTHLISWWCRRLLSAFNMQVLHLGHTPRQAPAKTMVIANHISWSDIHALNSLMPLKFIAKSEIKNWPIFGYLVSKANTIFIDRNKRQATKHIINTAKNSLEDGDNLCLFPEGTTTDGTEIRPFKTSLIEAAILAKATIQPVAIRYPGADGEVNTDVAYAGETTLIESMQKILKMQRPIIELHFLTPVTPDDYATMDRHSLTLHTEGLIRETLALI
ncbi:MAG: 1-acyl-sn-glycerol-3-phosphate acyltransferase [Betaproteobacteria bacterium HGW-Betaproteobacteria-22]|nr:MAG: 1-acyl-sn-glycerol-3-phosphate acyltransferase [Betaproteobacteria bacterium HGW-Betaproteobacteria-22]